MVINMSEMFKSVITDEEEVTSIDFELCDMILIITQLNRCFVTVHLGVHV